MVNSRWDILRVRDTPKVRYMRSKDGWVEGWVQAADCWVSRVSRLNEHDG